MNIYEKNWKCPLCETRRKALKRAKRLLVMREKGLSFEAIAQKEGMSKQRAFQIISAFTYPQGK